MNFPSTKQELPHRIRERHAEMEELLSSLSPAQMTAPVLDDGWSVKDSRAHLAAWASNMLGSPLLDLIIGDTYEHYAEHIGWIRAWLDKTA